MGKTGPPLMYPQRVRVQVTHEQWAAVNREAVLNGVTPSVILRRAIDAHLLTQPPTKTKGRAEGDGGKKAKKKQKAG